MSRDPLLIAVVGPTASGKTRLAIYLGEKFGGEIVNCDSVAMYRDFRIGTAKPTAEEQAQVPHHLLDCVEPVEQVTAGTYSRRARAVIGEIAGRDKLPIVAGGTGLYLRALLEGLFPGPERSEELRERLRETAAEKGSAHLHKILLRMDAALADKIHANDVPKLIRAIEVCLAARRPMSEQWQAGRNPLTGFRILRLGLDPPRQQLYERINQRVLAMFDAGLVEETTQLRAKYGDSAQPLSSIGYKQVVQLLNGELVREAAIAAVQQAHRNYAKRQMTWFRREPGVHWINNFGDEQSARDQATRLVENVIGEVGAHGPN